MPTTVQPAPSGAPPERTACRDPEGTDHAGQGQGGPSDGQRGEPGSPGEEGNRGSRRPGAELDRRQPAGMPSRERRGRGAVAEASGEQAAPGGRLAVGDGDRGLVPDVPAGVEQTPDQVDVLADPETLVEPADRREVRVERRTTSAAVGT